MNNETIDIISNKYDSLSDQEKKEIHDLYYDPETRHELKQQLEKIIFFKKPPTAQEFLDPKNGWLNEAIVQSIFPHIKQQLIEILDSNKNVNKIVMYGATRLGKSFLSRLVILYTIVYFHFLREPPMYFGLSPITRLAIYLISFKFEKTREIYLDPMYEIMKQSPKFKQIKFQDDVKKTQNKVGRDIIVWSPV